MLQLKKVSVKVGKKEILKDFNFEFEKGKVYAVMGPNGSGKSTLAYAIAGHPAYKLDVGSLKLDGKEIRDKKPEERAKMGIFLSFQNPLSLSGVTVFQLLRIALGKKKKLEMLQAAILDPKLVIFDEIDTGVDVDALKTIAEFMDGNKKGKTFIVITHYNRRSEERRVG